ncbi:hypothetical protein EW146_g5599 [Bondarzewia mesenterica]|uniref:Uncharacterized protein n=1 Tax=Bondarzewia mesenterica TaxID=1095465 RepID=A0A4S4LRZ7_9AGAM|nr:hypothetical protein EW146_g5599 [Bondarzewia mesenterica]
MRFRAKKKRPSTYIQYLAFTDRTTSNDPGQAEILEKRPRYAQGVSLQRAIAANCGLGERAGKNADRIKGSSPTATQTQPSQVLLPKFSTDKVQGLALANPCISSPHAHLVRRFLKEGGEESGDERTKI